MERCTIVTVAGCKGKAHPERNNTASWLSQMLPHLRLRMGLLSSLTPDSGGTASGSLIPSTASPRHLLLGTSDDLSVLEPAQRFSCSRRRVFAKSPINQTAEDGVLKNKTYGGGGRHTLHACAFTSWFLLRLYLSPAVSLEEASVASASRERATWRRADQPSWRHGLCFAAASWGNAEIGPCSDAALLLTTALPTIVFS